MKPTMRHLKHLEKGLIGLIIGFWSVGILKDHVALVHSSTHSLPYTYFLKLKTVRPVLGSYTCVHSPWYGGNVIKEIAGKPGDPLTYDEQGHLWIGEKLIGKPKQETVKGQLLTPIKAGAIPQGHVFLKGEHERSFDSRYAEMGLIPEDQLDGRLIGII